jgi:hypothetical protein
LQPTHPATATSFEDSGFIAAEESYVPDIHWLAPVTEADLTRVDDYITERRQTWEQHLEEGMTALTGHLGAAGYTPSIDQQHPGMTSRPGALGAREVAVSARLKGTEAIIAKMRRFGEPLRVMLDIWGYRVVIATEDELDNVATCCGGLWETPTPQELLLRQGRLQFEWWRDYRRRNHAGLSPATTPQYDQAIHLNRKAPFGTVEIQVITLDLYVRVHGDPTSEDSHDRFVARRQELLRGNG